MKRKITIVIAFDQSENHDWLWLRKKWKDLECDLISISTGDQIKRANTFLEGLNAELDKSNFDHDRISDYVDEFNWFSDC